MQQKQRKAAEEGGILSTIYFYILINTPLRLYLIGLIPSLDFEPKHKGLWLICVAMALTAALQARRVGKAQSARFLWALPVLAPSILSQFIGAEGMGWPECLLALANLILAGILTAKARAEKRAKWTVSALSTVLLIPTVLLALSWLAFGGEDSVAVRSYPCPYVDDVCTAEVQISDEGATGGSTVVTVLYHLAELPFGSLRIAWASYRTGWIDPGALEVRWIDSDTLEINAEVWNWREASRE